MVRVHNRSLWLIAKLNPRDCGVVAVEVTLGNTNKDIGRDDYENSL